jgi:hypothetical protein
MLLFLMMLYTAIFILVPYLEVVLISMLATIQTRLNTETVILVIIIIYHSWKVMHGKHQK